MSLKLSLACWDYDRTMALQDGRVRPEGITLIFLNYRVEETSVFSQSYSLATKMNLTGPQVF
ncbi:hypothetical protein DPV78_008194 [Talaromyces pinophilus]|nr:hypothetical protein DPV78_008194 [Talaromyces pinophilus]